MALGCKQVNTTSPMTPRSGDAYQGRGADTWSVNTTKETTKMTRTDTHSPKHFEPSEYREVGYFDNHHEDGGCWMDHSAFDAETVANFEGNYESRGKCDHCGAGPLRYGVVFLHVPTNELVVTGTICAARLNLASRSDFERRQLLELAVRKAKRARWAAESEDNAQAAAILEAVLETEGQWRDANEAAYMNGTRNTVQAPNSFLLDVAFKFRRYGSLSEAQVAAVIKSAARDAEFAARRAAEAEALAAAPELAEGRYELTGKVLSTKWQDNDFGGSLKMLVQLPEGNKVWGTVPSAINPSKGDTVTFTAKVERSRDDAHFGFFSRPTKAAVSTEEEVA